MQLGLIGLGKMGGNMRERLRRAGHEVVGFDRNPDVADVGTLPELVKALEGLQGIGASSEGVMLQPTLVVRGSS